MGITKGKSVKYHCANDCEQLGCPGHILRVDLDRGTDIYLVDIDGAIECYDENKLHAIIGSFNLLGS
jgi:hypothetical protein